MAEREGLPRSFNKINRIRDLSLARAARVYQSCVPKSSRLRFCRCKISLSTVRGHLLARRYFSLEGSFPSI